MAKANSDALKKHHFWILLGIVPVLVLVAVVIVTASVGGAINTKVAAYEGAQKEIDGKQAVKPDAAIKILDKQKDELEVKKTDLWKENWEKQIGVYYAKGPDGKPEAKQDRAANLFRWPTSPVLARFAYTAEYATDKSQLKFGDSLHTDTNDELNAFKTRDVYMAEFTNAPPGGKGTGMVDLVHPTEFNGSWRSVLRHVYFPDAAVGGASGWGNRLPSSEQVWLALEDIWVQRAILGQIKAVNDTIGAFRDARLFDANKQEVKDDRRRAFESRNWRVELEIAPDPDDKDRRLRIGGRVTNRTERLQPFGAGAALVLNVYLNDETAKPYVLKVPGQFVRGKATVPIAKLDEHLFAPGAKADKIVKVEQVFDTRTVPVRRIDAIALGFRDSRHALMELKMPEFEAFAKDAAKAAEGGGGDGGPMGGAPPPGGLTPPPGGGDGGATGGGSGGGAVESVLDGNRKRYVVITKQVRRMPVALSVVVDQAYIQDVLVAYANSPLRFQTTQVHWQRFRGQLGTTPESDPDGTGGPVTGSGPGSAGGTLSGPGTPDGPGALGSPRGFGTPPPGVGGGPRGAGPGGLSGPMGGGGEGPGGLLGGGGGVLSNQTTLADTQLTGGLVELSLYGIVSLYEKYEPAADPNATTDPVADPKMP